MTIFPFTFIASLTVITKLITGSFPKMQHPSHKGTAWHWARGIFQAGEEQSHKLSYFPARDDGRQRYEEQLLAACPGPLRLAPAEMPRFGFSSSPPGGGSSNPNTKKIKHHMGKSLNSVHGIRGFRNWFVIFVARNQDEVGEVRAAGTERAPGSGMLSLLFPGIPTHPSAIPRDALQRDAL